MSNHIWKVKKISNDEYHVLEYAHGLATEHPFVLARCSGPVPANDILVALYVQQKLKNDQIHLEGIAKTNLTQSAAELASVIRKWHTINE